MVQSGEKRVGKAGDGKGVNLALKGTEVIGERNSGLFSKKVMRIWVETRQDRRLCTDWGGRFRCYRQLG